MRFLAPLLLVSLLLSLDAHAYVDPGTGSVLLQILLGGFAGLALFGKLFWRRVTELFGRKPLPPPAAAPAPSDSRDVKNDR